MAQIKVPPDKSKPAPVPDSGTIRPHDQDASSVAAKRSDAAEVHVPVLPKLVEPVEKESGDDSPAVHRGVPPLDLPCEHKRKHKDKAGDDQENAPVLNKTILQFWNHPSLRDVSPAQKEQYLVEHQGVTKDQIRAALDTHKIIMREKRRSVASDSSQGTPSKIHPKSRQSTRSTPARSNRHPSSAEPRGSAPPSQHHNPHPDRHHTRSHAESEQGENAVVISSAMAFSATMGVYLGLLAAATIRWFNGGHFILFPTSSSSSTNSTRTDPPTSGNTTINTTPSDPPGSATRQSAAQVDAEEDSDCFLVQVPDIEQTPYDTVPRPSGDIPNIVTEESHPPCSNRITPSSNRVTKSAQRQDQNNNNRSKTPASFLQHPTKTLPESSLQHPTTTPTTILQYPMLWYKLAEIQVELAALKQQQQNQRGTSPNSTTRKQLNETLLRLQLLLNSVQQQKPKRATKSTDRSSAKRSPAEAHSAVKRTGEDAPAPSNERSIDKEVNNKLEESVPRTEKHVAAANDSGIDKSKSFDTVTTVHTADDTKTLTPDHCCVTPRAGTNLTDDTIHYQRQPVTDDTNPTGMSIDTSHGGHNTTTASHEFEAQQYSMMAQSLRQAIIDLVEQNAHDPAALRAGIETLYLYIGNLPSNPHAPRYRLIFTRTESFQKVQHLQGGYELLSVLGFVPSPDRRVLEWLPEQQLQQLRQRQQQEGDSLSSTSRERLLECYHVREAAAALTILRGIGPRSTAKKTERATMALLEKALDVLPPVEEEPQCEWIQSHDDESTDPARQLFPRDDDHHRLQTAASGEATLTLGRLSPLVSP